MYVGYFATSSWTTWLLSSPIPTTVTDRDSATVFPALEKKPMVVRSPGEMQQRGRRLTDHDFVGPTRIRPTARRDGKAVLFKKLATDTSDDRDVGKKLLGLVTGPKEFSLETEVVRYLLDVWQRRDLLGEVDRLLSECGDTQV
jgi:hypothetical protein